LIAAPHPNFRLQRTQPWNSASSNLLLTASKNMNRHSFVSCNSMIRVLMRSRMFLSGGAYIPEQHYCSEMSCYAPSAKLPSSPPSQDPGTPCSCVSHFIFCHCGSVNMQVPANSYPRPHLPAAIESSNLREKRKGSKQIKQRVRTLHLPP
jgi:hypothetical protein